MNRVFMLIILLLLINFISALSKHGLTIVISLDGFWYKYFDQNVTPTLKRLGDEGSSPPYMINIFPTKTYPNHFTIATGRYAEEHSVLENKLFDPIINKSLVYSEELFTFNKSIIPIWTLNEKAGDGRHSGVMMWPGGEYEYNGTKPTFSKSFSYNVSFEERVNTILNWITDPKTPANLILLYFEEPDGIGHAFGPNSSNVTKTLIRVDNIVKDVIDKLKENKISDYNLIILSDHGMSPIPYSHIIDIGSIVSNSSYDLYGSVPTLSLWPKEGKFEEVLKKFQEAASKNNSHFRVYTKEEIPDDWHFKNSPRVSPLFLLADNGYVFDTVKHDLAWNENYYNFTYGPNSTFGWHGYETYHNNMHPFFLAHGPAFKTNHKVNVFHTVDLYSLFAHVLNLHVSNSDHSGNFSRVKDLLQSSVSSSDKVSYVLGAGMISFLFVITILMGYACYLTITRTNICKSFQTHGSSNTRRNWSDVQYTALEDYHLLTVLSESDDNNM